MRFFPAFFLLLFTVHGQTAPGRYILEMDGEPLVTFAKQGKERSAEASKQIKGQHDLVRSLLGSRGIRVRGEVDTVANAVLVENADPAKLAGLPGVRKVHEVYMLRPLLDHAIQLLKIPAAWDKIGGIDKAGAGIKIAIVDTGIDPYHAGFQDSVMTIPDGFPKVSPEGNRQYTNTKIIVARSYATNSALDQDGHGTGVAMAAAGVLHLGYRPNMAGTAPKAWIGNYCTSEGGSSGSFVDNVLLALDDAVKDGMDVINLSQGSAGIRSALDDTLSKALSRAAAAGVIVVAAAGNDGPELTSVSNSGSVDNVISVGATQNDIYPTQPAVILPPSTRFVGVPASNSSNTPQIEGKMVDVFNLDRSGLACDPLPAGSLSGKIALIQRGTCLFADKFANARVAGAIAAVVFNNQTNPARSIMDVGTETLVGMMVARGDGQTLQDEIALNPDTSFILFFSDEFADDPNVVTDYSARGPSSDLLLKPDMLAIGEMVTATNGTTPGDPDSSFYVYELGTSFSSPLVAGAAGVLKGARPGLTAAQYRSLIINSAEPFPPQGGDGVLTTGAGRLNLLGALSSSISLSPTSIAFGDLAAQTTISRDITLTNVGQATETMALNFNTADSIKPELNAGTVSLGPGESQKVTLSWNQAAPPAGPYQGFLEISASGGSTARAPYWLGVRGGGVKQIALLGIPDSGIPGGTVSLYARVVDSAGLTLLDPPPTIQVISGGGAVRSIDLLGTGFSGAYQVSLRLGISGGVNAFRISAGDVTTEFRIQGAR